MTSATTYSLATTTELDSYLAKIRQYPLLSREEEVYYAKKWRDEGDVNAAHTLVTSNLRFVVKIAKEYKGYGAPILDLIQEGSVGLMQAVKRFDPDKGYKLISYAVFWIKSYIHNFLMATSKMVKIGTSRAHRKLFFKLRSFNAAQNAQSDLSESELIDIASEQFNSSKDDIIEMNNHLSYKDSSLDAPVGESSLALVDLMPSTVNSQEEQLSSIEESANLQATVLEAMESLNERERYIIQSRYMSDSPMQLKEIGNELGVSKQRVAQIEKIALEKLRNHLKPAA
ncbi:MAG: RNA polymerase factor sigma-32 [Deltaproteobacteria bacterium]|nr:RNA polymerase factor sigma-32 [Deltaproteobacteria bacterium]